MLVHVVVGVVEIGKTMEVKVQFVVLNVDFSIEAFVGLNIAFMSATSILEYSLSAVHNDIIVLITEAY